MAISGTNSVVDTSKRDNLQTTMSSDSYTSAVGASMSAESYAGIKPGFVSALHEAIESYCDELNNQISKLETNPDITQAFKGGGTVLGIKNLLTAIKEETKRYLDNFKEAEKAIIQGVQDVYLKQDESVGESINADTANLGS